MTRERRKYNHFETAGWGREFKKIHNNYTENEIEDRSYWAGQRYVFKQFAYLKTLSFYLMFIVL